MFILSSISCGLRVLINKPYFNHTSIYENSKSKVFKNIKVLGEIYNNLTK